MGPPAPLDVSTGMSKELLSKCVQARRAINVRETPLTIHFLHIKCTTWK